METHMLTHADWKDIYKAGRVRLALGHPDARRSVVPRTPPELGAQTVGLFITCLQCTGSGAAGSCPTEAQASPLGSDLSGWKHNQWLSGGF